MNNNEQKLMDVVNMTEQALDGVSHLMTVADWENLLTKRISDSNEGVKPLSADFIIRHKNEIRMDLLSLWTFYMIGTDVPGYDLNFMHRFWKFMNIDGLEDVHCISAKKMLGDKWSKVENLLKQNVKMLDSTAVLDFDTLDKQLAFLPTLADYEANPYHYDNSIFLTMLEFIPDIPDTFIEKFIHLVSFNCIFDNMNMSNERKTEILKKFSVRIGRTKRYLFPDGTVVKCDDFRDGVTPGNAYLDNVNRYATEDEKAIREIVAKFPRAVEDCDAPSNAAVMK